MNNTDTSVQVRTWVEKALHTDVWISATIAADAAISACPDTPITTAEDASARRGAWEALGQAIGDTEIAVKPLRSRIHDLRTELARRVTAVLEPAQDRVDTVRRILGAWDAQERVRQAAQEAEQRKTAAMVAHRALVQAQDGDRGVTEAQGSVFDPVVPQAPQDGLTAEGVDPFAPQPFTTDAESEEKEVPSAGPTGATRKTWIVEILDTDKLRAALIALPAGAKLQTALRVHEPTLRKMLANELGPDKAESAFPAGCVSVRSEDRAVRSRKATP